MPVPGGMRVLTMNLFGHHQDWPRRREVLVAGMREIAPDVALLQETVVSADDDQVADVLGEGFQVHHQPGRADDGVGASIASRWPMTVVREADLDTTLAAGDATSWIGSLAVVQVAVPDPIGSVLFVHHKPTWQSGAEAKRERQAVETARIVEELVAEMDTDQHVILAGDLDATPDAASIRFLTGRQSIGGMSVYYQDAWAALHADDPGHTFTLEDAIRSDRWRPRPGRRIDYIMVRCGDHGSGLDIVRCERAFDRPVGGVWASDHFGVWADFAPNVLTADPP